MIRFSRFFSIVIVVAMAVIIVPDKVLAVVDTLSVPDTIRAVAGADISVPVVVGVTIYGGQINFRSADKDPVFFGARLSGFSSAGPRTNGAALLWAFSEPTGGHLADVMFRPTSGEYRLMVTGELTVATTMQTFSVEEVCIMLIRTSGDTDGNNVVDATDVLALSAGIIGYAGQPIWIFGVHPEGDMDANRRLDYMDVVHLLRKVLGLPSLLRGKVVAAGNTPEVIANARKALADLSDKEGPVADQLRQMIVQLVPEVSIVQPTAVETTTWGALKSAYR